MTTPVEVGSRQACCFHEAGHAIAAALCGLRVSGVHVGRTFPFNSALFASLGHGSEIVSLAGMAIEMRLVDAELVIWNNEVVRSQAKLFSLWSKTCLGDFRIWAEVRADRLGHREPPPDGWSCRFRSEAAALSKYLSVEIVEPIALALKTATWLPGEQIHQLLAHASLKELAEPLQRWIEQGYIDLEPLASA